jgi:hypothetical protein
MMLVDGDFIQVGSVDYTDKFLNAMRNWQKCDYAYRERFAKETLQDWYETIDKKGKVINGKKRYIFTKEEKYTDYLETLERAKQQDEERKRAEKVIENKLRYNRFVGAVVIQPLILENGIRNIDLGLKVGHIDRTREGYLDMQKDVLIFSEYQKFEEQEERTDLIWSSDLYSLQYIYLRTNNTRPLKLLEWYQKKSNKTFW